MKETTAAMDKVTSGIYRVTKLIWSNFRKKNETIYTQRKFPDSTVCG